jgi:chromosome segregation ATPase
MAIRTRTNRRRRMSDAEKALVRAEKKVATFQWAYDQAKVGRDECQRQMDEAEKPLNEAKAEAAKALEAFNAEAAG